MLPSLFLVKDHVVANWYVAITLAQKSVITSHIMRLEKPSVVLNVWYVKKDVPNLVHQDVLITVTYHVIQETALHVFR